MKFKQRRLLKKLLTFSEFHFKALRIIMIAFAGVMIGFGAFSLFAKEKIDVAHEMAEQAAVNFLRLQAKSGLNLPAVDDDVACALLAVRVHTVSPHQRFIMLGPKDLAIVDKVELIRVKAQKKRDGNDVSLIRFKHVQ